MSTRRIEEIKVGNRVGKMSRAQRIFYEAKLEIIGLADGGMPPLEISQKLKIQLPLIFRTLTWRRHMMAHKKAASSLRRQLREHTQAQSKLSAGNNS